MNENNFVGYEYKRVVVPNEQESLWCDSMQSFGWIVDKRKAAHVKPVWGPIRLMLAPLALLPGFPFAKMIKDHDSDTQTELTFKRDKRIEGKAELVRLQAQFENYARGIESLENTKSFGARIAAYVIALIGTAFMAGSVFAMLAGMIPLTVILAIPAFVGWVLPYFIFRSMTSKRTKTVEPQIEKQYDGIYDVCQQASSVFVGA